MEQYQILKNLALEFESSRDPAIFEKIVVKIERFLVYTINKARKSKPYLKKVEMQDLYQIAVLGLHKALLKVKEDEPGSKLLYKIWRYIGNEIALYYKPTNRVTFPISVSKVALQVHLYFADMPCSQAYVNQIEDKLVEYDTVYKNLELEFIRERFLTLLEEEVISFEEFEMITMRFVNDMPYKDIAKQFDTTGSAVSKRIQAALNRLRYEFRRRGWE